jgi:3,4-dihydroxy-2-butanone 4-phosphate synthase
MPKLLNALPAARSVAQAARAIAVGGLAVVLDEAHGSGDLVAAAATVSPEVVNVMVREARGLVCVALAAAQVDRLRLRPMASGWERPPKAFTVSVDAREGITTGISAGERAHTIRTLVAAETTAGDLVVPGHVFPLRAGASPPGRPLGRTEAALALVQLAGRGLGAVLCEMLDDEGELADPVTLAALAERLRLPLVSTSAISLARAAGEGTCDRRSVTESRRLAHHP